MVQASTEFKKSGYSDADAATLANIAQMYRNVADEEISAGEAAGFIISQMKAFNIEAENAEHIIDAVNETANNFAVSSADLSNSLGKGSAALKVVGVTFEEQLGLLTGITEVTRNANTAMRGLTSMSSRLTQVLDSTSATGKKLVAAYSEVGVEIFDTNGQMRDAMDIWTDLAAVWDTLDSNTQKYIAVQSAGANQVKNFSAMMQNFNTVLDATATAYNSTGSAAKENAKVMDSIAKKVEIVKSEFQQLVTEGGALQELAKDLLDVAIKVMEFLNTAGGKTLILATAITGLTVGGAALVKTLAAAALTAKGFTAAEVEAQIATMGFAGALKTASAAFLTSPFFLASAVLVSFAALVATAEKFNTSLEKQTERFRECSDAYNEAKNEVEQLENELKNVREQIEKINSEGGAQVADKSQLQELEKQEAVLIRQLALKKQIAAEAQKAAQAAAEEAYHNSQVTVKKDTGLTDTTILMSSNVAIEKSTKAYADNQIQIESLTEALTKYVDENGNVIAGYEEVFDKTNQRIESLQDEQEAIQELANGIAEDYGEIIEGLPDGEIKTHMENMADSWLLVTGAMEEAKEEFAEVDDALVEEEEEVEEAASRLEELAEAHGIAVEDLEKLADAVGLSAEALIDYADAMGVSIEQAATYLQSVESWNNSIDSLQDAYGKLTDAVEEYNETGEMSLDTLQALLELSPEYLNMLTEENGKLVLNEEAIVNKANALIEERKQTALQIAYDKLAAIERGNNANAADNEAASVAGSASALRDEANALSLNTVQQYANQVSRQGSGKSSAARQVMKDLQSELKVLDKLGTQYGKVSTSAIKSGSSRSKAAGGATKSLNDENKALQDLKSQYDTVISWINKQYDRKINEIQKSKSAAVDAIQDEIDALNKRKKAEVDGISNTIKARQKEKEEALKSIEAQIKGIEKERDARIGALQAEKKALEKERDAENDAIQEKIDLLKEEKAAAEDAIQSEIDSLKELKEERQDYWDEEINRLKEANEQRKDALELQQYLDNLEKAKNTKVKVYKQGEGFVYDTDQTKVNEAQKQLDDYLSEKAYEDELDRLEKLKAAELDNYQDRIDALTKFKNDESKNYQEQIENLTKLKDNRKKSYDEQLDALTDLIEQEKDKYEEQLDILKDHKDATSEYYEEQIDALNDYKDQVQDSYDEQIDMLNDHKDAVEDAYDAEIEMYQQYKQAFEDMCNEYEDAQARLLFEQLTGLSAENDNWMTRLDNLRQFVNEYNRLQAQLNSGTTNASYSYGGSSTPVSSGSNYYTPTSSASIRYKTTDDRGNNLNAGYAYDTQTNKVVKVDYNKKDTGTTHTSIVGSAYADGVEKVKEDEIALVGENPHKELVVGSKINTGQLMALDKGTGVVNAKSTKSMAGLLNQLGMFGGSAFGSGGGTLNNNTTSSTENFTIDNVSINGSGIVDPQSFKTAMLQFKNDAIQRAYKR